MLHFARLYKHKVSFYKKMLRQNELNHLNAAMTAIYQGMLKSAAAHEMQQAINRREGRSGKVF